MTRDPGHRGLGEAGSGRADPDGEDVHRHATRCRSGSVGCNTFPTWNSWPGLFASLVTGNAVVVKPQAGAVLPLAITVQVCQEVLSAAGLDPQPGHPRRRRPGRQAGRDLGPGRCP